MKWLITLLAVATLATMATAQEEIPGYEKGQWYVWSAEKAAVAASALAYINGTDWFPRAGQNAGTGKVESEKAKTTKWADAVVTLTDGRVGFPRIPEKVLDALGVPAEDRIAFWVAFQAQAVVVTSDMLPVVEEE